MNEISLIRERVKFILIESSLSIRSLAQKHLKDKEKAKEKMFKNT